jgi:23S rRNA (cytidine1920-2'-O)/16S rRNA (cytidine1409-2'-O)-methyltransferase
MAVRLDQKLVALQLAPSRSKAQELIRSGNVEIFHNHQWQREQDVAHPASHLSAASIRLVSKDLLAYVSRAGLKLEGLLKKCELSPKGLRVLDVGISTGGFTDCLIQKDVESVVGLDVGHDQLATVLRDHPKLVLFERLNVRDLASHPDFLKTAAIPFDWIVMDVSFISHQLALPSALPFLKPGGLVIALIKPQFELGASALNKKGVVKDIGLYDELKVTIEKSLKGLGLRLLRYEPSEVKGHDGNQEFFAIAQKS